MEIKLFIDADKLVKCVKIKKRTLVAEICDFDDEHIYIELDKNGKISADNSIEILQLYPDGYLHHLVRADTECFKEMLEFLGEKEVISLFT